MSPEQEIRSALVSALRHLNEAEENPVPRRVLLLELLSSDLWTGIRYTRMAKRIALEAGERT